MKYLQYRCPCSTYRVAIQRLSWIGLLCLLLVRPIFAAEVILSKSSETSNTHTESPLWEYTHTDSSFDVQLASERDIYQLNEYLKLTVSATRDAHFILFNWDGFGTLTLLFPNRYQPNNFVTAETQRQVPEAREDFNFRLSGPPGVERLKLIALRTPEDNQAILDLLPKADTTLQSIPNTERLKLEKQILTRLGDIQPENWATTQHTVTISGHETIPDNGHETIPDSVSPVYTTGNIIYIKHKDYKYFAKILGDVEADAETVQVRIFNKNLRKEIGKRISTAAVVDKYTEPEKGWGNQLMLLEFYRGGKWLVAKDAVAFENYFRLPEKTMDGQSIQGPHDIKLKKVRIPIFQHKP